MKLNIYSSLILLLFALLASCKSPESLAKTWESEDKLKVVVTTTMLGDLVRSIGGDKIEVKQLMDHKVDPHGYVHTNQDLQALQSADLILYNGLHLEAKMQRVFSENSAVNAVAVGEKLDPKYLLNGEGERDPHIWGSPLIWEQVTMIVADQLSASDKTNADFYTKNAKSYSTSIQELHKWAQNRMNEVNKESRVLVTSHDAFQYFANSYNYQVKGLQGLSSDEEVGVNATLKLAEYIKKKGIKTIFAETTVNEKGLTTVAQECGIVISKTPLFSDACGERGKIETVNGESYDIGSYIGMFKHNVNTVVTGLK